MRRRWRMETVRTKFLQVVIDIAGNIWMAAYLALLYILVLPIMVIIIFLKFIGRHWAKVQEKIPYRRNRYIQRAVDYICEIYGITF